MQAQSVCCLPPLLQDIFSGVEEIALVAVEDVLMLLVKTHS